ncbi:MAG: hypothetical protein HY370_05290 [Proteobacteria bacterium]|nr:hypothetical protein [Pseudomonadota bacterium]
MLAIPKEDYASMGIDPYRYRLDFEKASVNNAPGGDYVLVVTRAGSKENPVVAFNIHARGSSAIAGQTGFRILDYYDAMEVKGSVTAETDIFADEEFMKKTHEKTMQLGSLFLKEKLSSLLDANEPFFNLLATSINNSFVPDIVGAVTLRNGNFFDGFKMPPNSGPEMPPSFEFGGR